VTFLSGRDNAQWSLGNQTKDIDLRLGGAHVVAMLRGAAALAQAKLRDREERFGREIHCAQGRERIRGTREEERWHGRWLEYY
jgi:hypothetical protein